MKGATCPFCQVPDDRLLTASGKAIALWDAYPVSPGHALIVPRRHIADWFDATEEEQLEMMRLVSRARQSILETHSPEGFNIGVNVGAAAGQTVEHLHVHLIPRYPGDVEDPRGGVRWVLPGQAAYWEA